MNGLNGGGTLLSNHASVAFYFNSATDGAAAFDLFTVSITPAEKIKKPSPQFTDVGRGAA